MKALIRVAAVVVAIPFASLQIVGGTSVLAAPTCKPTGLVYSGVNLTARLINPKHVVHGDVDGQGCNLGIYFGPGHKGTVFQADVHDASDYGLLNNGAQVNVEDSAFHDIGQVPFGTHLDGNGIAFVPSSHRSTGKIIDNLVYRF